MRLTETPHQRAVWDALDRLIETMPCDGVSAEGLVSEAIRDRQTAFINGIRAARLCAVRALSTTPKETNNG